MNLNCAFEEWAILIGQDRVLNGKLAELNYGRCTTGENRRLSGVLKLLKPEDIAPIIKTAVKHQVPLYPISTGHNWGYGTALPPVDNCVILDLSELNRIIDFDAETGVVTVEPGVTQGQLADFLDQGEYPYMTPTTGAGKAASILGNALERGYGITPYTDHFGAVMAIHAVLPDGSFYRSALTDLGGEQLDRSFKWGVGPYIDGIFSQGSVGVVTQMTIALARRPEVVQSFLFGLKQPEKLGNLVSRVRDVIARYPGVVGGINLMNAHRVLAMTTTYPRERVVPGEAISLEILQELMQKNMVLPWMGLGTLYGSKRVVNAVKQELKLMLSPVADRLLFVTDERIQILTRLGKFLPNTLRSRLTCKLEMLERSLQLISGYPNQTALPLCYWLKGKPQQDAMLDPARDGCGLIWYAPLIPMKQASVVSYVQMVYDIMAKYRLEPLMTLTSLSARCFDSTVPILFDLNSEPERRKAESCYWELMEKGKEYGFLPYRVGIQAMSWLSENNSSYWQTVRKIKRSLDPSMIISPGRYI
ncbi:MAG: FAD-binding oxidoreductase [Nitrosomonas sp. H1_AOB3]|nr:MAG: FAD-binding oxidoreductase [Nitrosomonas sp. H1_AOB3]